MAHQVGLLASVAPELTVSFRAVSPSGTAPCSLYNHQSGSPVTLQDPALISRLVLSHSGLCQGVKCWIFPGLRSLQSLATHTSVFVSLETPSLAKTGQFVIPCILYIVYPVNILMFFIYFIYYRTSLRKYILYKYWSQFCC